VRSFTKHSHGRFVCDDAPDVADEVVDPLDVLAGASGCVTVRSGQKKGRRDVHGMSFGDEEVVVVNATWWVIPALEDVVRVERERATGTRVGP
jgi:hypothetical protein